MLVLFLTVSVITLTWGCQWVLMGTNIMIPVPAPLDKYDTRVRPVPSWVPTIRIPADIEVYMGIHGYPWIFEFIYFLVQIITFLIIKKLQLLNIHTSSIQNFINHT